jgi:hypothetical protein
MIKQIMLLLNGLDHYGRSETIEIAKGKNEYPSSFKSTFKQIKRLIEWRKRK